MLIFLFSLYQYPIIFFYSHFCKIQDKSEDFYRQFQLIVCGLDSVPARRWINGMLLSMVQYEDKTIVPGTNIPMIDGGTEGMLNDMCSIRESGQFIIYNFKMINICNYLFSFYSI